MFERFTEGARQVVVLAQAEARALGHNYIGTEHILLGLVAEEQGVAAQVLARLGITPEPARAAVARMVGPGEESASGQIPFTGRAKKVLERGLREALSLGHNYIGTEHILIGLATDTDGVAARVLLEFGVESEVVRGEVHRELSRRHPQSDIVGPSARSHADSPSDAIRGMVEPVAWWVDQLPTVVQSGFGRPADVGDLMLALAVPGGLLERALAEMSVDLDGLREALDRQRRGSADRSGSLPESLEGMARKLEALRAEQSDALKNDDYVRSAAISEERARLHVLARVMTREHEQRLLRKARARTGQSARSRLGARRRLTRSPDPDSAEPHRFLSLCVNSPSAGRRTVHTQAPPDAYRPRRLSSSATRSSRALRRSASTRPTPPAIPA